MTDSSSPSYYHIDYAGNRGDVIKHLILMSLLRNLQHQPTFYLETHAGSGVYSVQENRRYQQGMGALLEFSKTHQSAPLAIQQYCSLVKKLNPQGNIQNYPGSPWFAMQLSHKQSQLHFCELNSRIVQQLQTNSEDDKRVNIWQQNGFQKSVKLLANHQLKSSSTKTVMLIDPPYSDKNDWHAAIKTIQESYAIDSTLIILLWYPLMRNTASENHSSNDDSEEKRLNELRDLNVEKFEMTWSANKSSGMIGCGVLGVNIPAEVTHEIEEFWPYLQSSLAD